MVANDTVRYDTMQVSPSLDIAGQPTRVVIGETAETNHLGSGQVEPHPGQSTSTTFIRMYGYLHNNRRFQMARALRLLPGSMYFRLNRESGPVSVPETETDETMMSLSLVMRKKMK
ncbi:hypothetical protein FPOAC2_01419 [Fusarium poae]